MELTTAAQKNLAAGGVAGPGTGVCRKCEGTKEPTRLNSAMCRACEKGDRVKPPRKKKRSLTVWLTDDEMRAVLEQGVTETVKKGLTR